MEKECGQKGMEGHLSINTVTNIVRLHSPANFNFAKFVLVLINDFL
jgi:hypothetical protein